MLYLVYELTNHRLKTIFLGITDQPLDKLLAKHRKEPPILLKDWQLPELRNLRIVEICFDEKSARRCLQDRLKESAPPSWKTISEAA
ncbi:MAG: hypothetical protein HY549_11000 [Elusimicrobia bacterium]|nr:hypothetical protein [Elusimicrobiota bacterium]